MSEETWVPVSGYEDRYEISINKEIRNKERDIRDINGNVLYHVKSSCVPAHTSYGSKPYVILSNGVSSIREDIEKLYNKSFK